MVSLEQTDEQLKRSIQKHGIEWFEELEMNGAGKCAIDYETQICVVRLKHYPESAFDWSVLTHELLHAIFRSFRDLGLHLCEKSEEAFTYMMGYLTFEVMKKIESCNS